VAGTKALNIEILKKLENMGETTMQDLKIPRSDSYHDYLIESLKDIEEAAGYIEIVLEEGHDDPRLLPKALRNVTEAHLKMNKLSDSAQLLHQNLDKILTESKCAEIYAFVQFLDAMGLKIAIGPLAPEPSNLTLETENNPETVTA
jgi:DNA-binding phage protein